MRPAGLAAAQMGQSRRVLLLAPRLSSTPRLVAVAAGKRRVATAGTVEEELHAHFAAVYGDRWPCLWEAMRQPTRHVAWAGPLAAPPPEGWRAPWPGLPYCYEREQPYTKQQQQQEQQEQEQHQQQQQQQQEQQPRRHRQEEGDWDGEEGEEGAGVAGPQQPSTAGRPCAPRLYLLDLASLFPALALGPRAGQSVADLCAAPGGKSLVLAAQLFGGLRADGGAGSGGASGAREQMAGADDHGLLICNDRSRPRRTALGRVLQAHLPPALLAGGLVRPTCRDAARWPHTERGAFDAVLLDAPCSSERHLAQRPGPLLREEWSPSRSKRNAQAQLALLMSGLRLLAPNGRLVYSTCSVSPTENDGVVTAALKKSAAVGAGARVATDGRWAALLGPGGALRCCAAAVACERTKHGIIALPDATGHGPLYFSVIEVDQGFSAAGGIPSRGAEEGG